MLASSSPQVCLSANSTNYSGCRARVTWTHSSLLKELDVDPHIRAEQMGHTIDVNENVYTITSLKRRREAMNALENAIGA